MKCKSVTAVRSGVGLEIKSWEFKFHFMSSIEPLNKIGTRADVDF